MRSDHESSKKPPKKPAQSAKKLTNKNKDMGAALRSVYQKAVEEPIPDEMLDLLGKLG